MRIAAQVKGGFYPAPDDAIDAIADRLVCGDPDDTNILDPCCGKGEAIGRLAEALGVPRKGVWAVELDAARSQTALAHLEGAHVLPDCDFLGTDANVRSFGLAWVNPPFDDEIGGGARVEYRFLGKATPLLVAGGVLCLICPAKVAAQDDVRRLLMTWYRDLCVVPFPDHCRTFNEVCVFGVKRKEGVEGSKLDWDDTVLDECPGYEVPAAPGPRTWAKAALTQMELEAALRKSGLRRLLAAPPPARPPQPALQLGKGQQALVLAGGFLNQVLYKEGAEPVLIKATPYKADYLKSTITEVNEETDSSKTTTIYGQKIGLKVRVLTASGSLHTLQDMADKPAVVPQDEEGDGEGDS